MFSNITVENARIIFFDRENIIDFPIYDETLSSSKDCGQGFQKAQYTHN